MMDVWWRYIRSLSCSVPRQTRNQLTEHSFKLSDDYYDECSRFHSVKFKLLRNCEELTLYLLYFTLWCKKDFLFFHINLFKKSFLKKAHPRKKSLMSSQTLLTWSKSFLYLPFSTQYLPPVPMSICVTVDVHRKHFGVNHSHICITSPFSPVCNSEILPMKTVFHLCSFQVWLRIQPAGQASTLYAFCVGLPSCSVFSSIDCNI